MLCRTCRYSELASFKLFCRRRAPLRGIEYDARWPKVRGDDWCGEYRAAVESCPACHGTTNANHEFFIGPAERPPYELCLECQGGLVVVDKSDQKPTAEHNAQG